MYDISQYEPVTKNGGIFTEYVNTFLKIKQEASSWPEWCKTKEDQQMYINNYYEKEGTWLTAEHIKKNLSSSLMPISPCLWTPEKFDHSCVLLLQYSFANVLNCQNLLAISMVTDRAGRYFSVSIIFTFR
jgi:hypothetical protein